MKIVIEVASSQGSAGNPGYRIFNNFPISIGRGFDNDIIVNDPYVDEKHAEISLLGNGHLSISDEKSLNGVFVNGKSVAKSSLKFDDIIKIGMTEIKVLSPSQKVSPALRLEKKNLLVSLIEKPYSALLFMLMALLTVQIWSYFEIWTDERQVVAAASVAGVLGLAVVWSALWSVASRLVINNSNFSRHMTVVSIYMILSVCVWYLLTYINFLSNENLFASVVNYIVNFLAIAFVIYLSLCFANNMQDRKRIFSSVLFSFGVVSGIFLLNYINSQQFSLLPGYSSSMEPYLSSLAPANTIDEFCAENEKLFARKTFTEDD